MTDDKTRDVNLMADSLEITLLRFWLWLVRIISVAYREALLADWVRQ
jgi:hypothetical protein